MAIKYSELSEALEFVSAEEYDEHAAFADRETGKIYWVSEVIRDALEEELPEDVETSERYVAIPNRRDLRLGSRIALRFAAEVMPDEYPRIREFFEHRGAYARFHSLLAQKHRQRDWDAYESECTKVALREWAEAHGLEIVDDASRTPLSSAWPRRWPA